MNKILNFLKINSWWISLTLSIGAICFSYLRATPFEMDWAGFVLGVLALLTSALISWQIFALFDFKKEKEESLKSMLSIANSISADRILLADSLFNYFMTKKEDYEVIKYGYDLISLTQNQNEFLKLTTLMTIIQYSSNGIRFKYNYQLDEALGLIASLKPMFLGSKEGIEYLQIMTKRIRQAKIDSQL
ncbi:hypothetical protein [Chishuiella sp.]|uniref:hypothetical protein n=1 Tax=Chishuiella sp. TaxID=1969467 RepID=UPI0028AF77DF|nr:hypothetical protein [Chishuiella sp.]